MTHSVAVLVSLAVVSSACARRIPGTSGDQPDTPRVSWVLMHGDRDTADREFACQSDPKTDCVLPASRPDAQVFSDIHFYYHGAGGETRYEGTKHLAYLQGQSDSHTSRINVTVRKNETMTNESVIGIVTSTPGTYTVTVLLTATITSAGTPHPVRESFQVSVK